VTVRAVTARGPAARALALGPAALAQPLSVPVTRLGERLAWTALLLVLFVALCLLMWRGWRRRAARQADLPPLPEPPAPLSGDLVPPVRGVYVSSTTAGDWLDRIVVRDLGVRSRAVMHVTGAGVSFDRVGATDVFIPAAWLRGVRREGGMAGKFVGRDAGLVVLTWELGDRMLDTGFRVDRSADSDVLVSAVGRLVTEGSVS
jgi:hypothetical protein